jgi:hypothetical protein
MLPFFTTMTWEVMHTRRDKQRSLHNQSGGNLVLDIVHKTTGVLVGTGGK